MEEDLAKSGPVKQRQYGTGDVSFGSTSRTSMPSWIRDEQALDKGNSSGLARTADPEQENEVPDHFNQMLKAQEEWYQFEIYARVCMLYGVIQFLFAVTYYVIGTTMSELRGMWIAWSLPLLFLTAQALILRLDVLRSSRQRFLPHY